jgi:hypothetical protein
MSNKRPQRTQELTGGRQGEETATGTPSVEELLFENRGRSVKKIVTEKKKRESSRKGSKKKKKKEMSPPTVHHEDSSGDAAAPVADSNPAVPASLTTSPIPVPVPGSDERAGPPSVADDASHPAVTASLTTSPIPVSVPVPGSDEIAGPPSAAAAVTASLTTSPIPVSVSGIREGAGPPSVAVPTVTSHAADSTALLHPEVGSDIPGRVPGAEPATVPTDTTAAAVPGFTGNLASADLSLISQNRHIRLE